MNDPLRRIRELERQVAYLRRANQGFVDDHEVCQQEADELAAALSGCCDWIRDYAMSHDWADYPRVMVDGEALLHKRTMWEMRRPSREERALIGGCTNPTSLSELKGNMSSTRAEGDLP